MERFDRRAGGVFVGKPRREALSCILPWSCFVSPDGLFLVKRKMRFEGSPSLNSNSLAGRTQNISVSHSPL